MTTITTTKATILAVSVPQNAEGLKLHEGVFLCYFIQTCDWSGPLWTNLNLPPGQWEIVGRLNAVTEEQWSVIVETLSFSDPAGLLPAVEIWKNYQSENPMHYTSTESGHSLLKANGYYSKNPYGEKEPEDISDLGAFTQARRQTWKLWQAAEKNVNPLILKMI